jgi:hypothetical protein
MRAGVGLPSAADYGQVQPFGRPKDHRPCFLPMRDSLMDEVFGNDARRHLVLDPTGAVQPDSFPCDQCRQGTLSGEAGKVQILESAASSTISDSGTDRSAAESPTGHQNPVHAHDGARRDPPPGSGPSPERPSFCWPTTWISGRSSRATWTALPYKTRPSCHGCRRGLSAVQNRDCRRGVCRSGELSVASVARSVAPAVFACARGCDSGCSGPR